MNTTQAEDDFNFNIAGDPWNKVVLVTFFALEQVIGNSLLIGLIWYEHHGRDIHRTLLNQLFSQCYVSALWGNVTIQVFDFVILWANPGFPQWCCWLKDVLTKFSILFGYFVALEVSILKYLYLIVWKRVLAMNDDFVATFLWWLNITLGLWIGLLDHLLVGPNLITYHLCMNTDWRKYPVKLLDSRHIVPTIVGLIIGLDLAIFIRICVYNINSFFKTTTVVPFRGNTELGSARPQGCMNHLLNAMSFKPRGAIFSVGVSTLVNTLYVVSLSPLIAMFHIFEDNPLELNERSNSLLYILAHYLPIFVLYVLIPVIYFATHQHMIKMIVQQLLEDLPQFNWLLSSLDPIVRL